MTPRAWMFAAITLLGFLLTQFQLLKYFDAQGQSAIEGMLSFDVGTFVAAAFANPAASFIGLDVLVCVTCFLLWLFPEGRRLGMRHLWVYVLLTFMVAVGVSFPAFMMMRERALSRAGRT